METHSIVAYIPSKKTYRVQRHKFRGKLYEGNCDGLAQWYYTHVNPTTDNLHIHVFGDVHQTFPNPYHLSVEYEEETGAKTERYHMSSDGYGNFYKQALSSRANLKKTKRRKHSTGTKKRKRHSKRVK